jgi:putative hydroxymethylpyrimidine transport system substrate-binding protein
MRGRGKAPWLGLAALVAAVALVAGCGGDDDDEAAPAPAETQAEAEQPKEPVRIRYQLVWTASANATPVIVAERRGFYEEEGLDVEIRESQDPTAAIPLVGEGESQMGASYPPDIMLAAAKDVPVVAVQAQYQSNPLGIVSLEDGANIQTPEDMVGKRIGVTALPMDRAQFDVMLENAGIAKDDVEVVDPGFNGGTLVGEGRLDGASAVPWFEVVALKAAGEKPTLMEYRTNGGEIDFPFIVTMANADWAEDNADAIRAFVRATIRGHEYAVANPDEAVDLVVEAFPNLDRNVQEIMWQEVIPLTTSDLTEEQNIGYLDMEQLQGLEDFLSEHGLLERDVDVESIFTNEYQPSE